MLDKITAQHQADFVDAVVKKHGLANVSARTSLSGEDLERWARGEDPPGLRSLWALYGFCLLNRDFDLLQTYYESLPAFDLRSQVDFAAGPVGSSIPAPRVGLNNRPTTLAGLPVNFPIGIGASVLTRNWQSIAFYAARGFDVLTYKTVRSIKTDAHRLPNWVFVRSSSVPEIRPPFNRPVVGDVNYWPDDPENVAMANSFGVPSMTPDEWMPDVRRAKTSIGAGQILVVSVTSSPSDSSEAALLQDFVSVAKMAKEAGADIIEANYSCPNTPGNPSGDVYQDPELSGRISAALASALGQTPLFVKIGYLEEVRLREFAAANSRHTSGIVAINTIPMTVKAPDGSELFPGRVQAGISGTAIRPWAQAVIRNLVAIRDELNRRDDWSIIAVGGVTGREDVDEYLNLGANAVESCTGAFLNPLLAIQVRETARPGRVEEVSSQPSIAHGEFAQISTSGPPTEQGPEQRVALALSDPLWDFWTADALASSTGLPRRTVESVIESYPELIRESSARDSSGAALYTLQSKPVTTRERLAAVRQLLVPRWDS